MHHIEIDGISIHMADSIVDGLRKVPRRSKEREPFGGNDNLIILDLSGL